ncbi:hypothetical protein NL529_33315, partial [Klebsiella pneumoniae]|nr:hypothetical protein [Klebsiella pneumoniae]
MEKHYASKFQSHKMERQLYHGTKESAVLKICATGVDRSYSGTANAVCFGCGAYFARDMSYSAQDQYS